jgi:hypothetical protein
LPIRNSNTSSIARKIYPIFGEQLCLLLHKFFMRLEENKILFHSLYKECTVLITKADTITPRKNLQGNLSHDCCYKMWMQVENCINKWTNHLAGLIMRKQVWFSIQKLITVIYCISMKREKENYHLGWCRKSTDQIHHPVIKINKTNQYVIQESKQKTIC